MVSVQHSADASDVGGEGCSAGRPFLRSRLQRPRGRPCVFREFSPSTSRDSARAASVSCGGGRYSAREETRKCRNILVANLSRDLGERESPCPHTDRQGDREASCPCSAAPIGTLPWNTHPRVSVRRDGPGGGSRRHRRRDRSRALCFPRPTVRSTNPRIGSQSVRHDEIVLQSWTAATGAICPCSRRRQRRQASPRRARPSTCGHSFMKRGTVAWSTMAWLRCACGSRTANRDVRPDDVADPLQDLALAVPTILRDHRAVQEQDDDIQGHRRPQFIQQHPADARRLTGSSAPPGLGECDQAGRENTGLRVDKAP